MTFYFTNINIYNNLLMGRIQNNTEGLINSVIWFDSNIQHQLLQF